MYRVRWFYGVGLSSQLGDNDLISLVRAKIVGSETVKGYGGYFIVLQQVRGKKWHICFDSRNGY